MDGFAAWVDQAINNLRAGVTKGVVLPKVVVQRTLPQLEAFGRLEEPQQTIFWRPLLSFPAGPTVADRRRLLKAYDEKLRTQVLPAYRRLHDYLAQEYLPHARDTVAWSDLPSGDLWYAHLVRQHTTLDLTPAAVHELGLREVARLRANLVALQGPLGVPGDARTLFDAMRADPQFHFSSARSLLNAYEGDAWPRRGTTGCAVPASAQGGTGHPGDGSISRRCSGLRVVLDPERRRQSARRVLREHA